MNYNMQNMKKSLPELLSMLETDEVEIKKEHQVLMANKTTSFKKNGKKGNPKGNFKKDGKFVAMPHKKAKAGPKLARALGTGSAISQNIWLKRRTGR
jgi:hypothetical protein